MKALSVPLTTVTPAATKPLTASLKSAVTLKAALVRAPTAEEQGLAAMVLGAIIKANESEADVSGLLTHAERLTTHSAALVPPTTSDRSAKRA